MRILMIVWVLSLILASSGIASLAKPQLVRSVDDDFHIYRKDGRYYVIGSRETLESFLNHGRIPYSRTLLGYGPIGETVVFEIDKNNPNRIEVLQEQFMDTEITYIFY